MIARELHVFGAVQGIGFRPFVHRLARDHNLTGFVRNTPDGAVIRFQGPAGAVDRAIAGLREAAPRAAVITGLDIRVCEPDPLDNFRILPSTGDGEPTALVMRDLATCNACMDEVRDPQNRRYRYPFTNCTDCGPRFSIIERLPYDRPNTTMKAFEMCDDCRREYEDPDNRRYHAQPNACPVCGPRVWLADTGGKERSSHHDAVLEAAAIVRDGGILAIKGIGGFHLVADAGNTAAVSELRARKKRDAKPFAVMMPTLATAAELLEISPREEALLTSPAAPILLLRRNGSASAGKMLSAEIAPGNPLLGVMLPYSPLHHLLLEACGTPVVATSGNLSDEPICIDNEEAAERLKDLADAFLVHNRDIIRPVDDSIMRIVAGEPVVLRRSRGFAPLPVRIPETSEGIDTLALGAHLKNTAALHRGHSVFISQHLGDLDTLPARKAFEQAVETLEDLYHHPKVRIVCDLHPDYASTRYAESRDRHPIRIQHHVAHAAACMAEHGLHGPVLATVWDGTGYGTDGTIWGGEWFVMADRSWRRVAHLRPFPLPGGDRAAREPHVCAAALLFECCGKEGLEQHAPGVRCAFDPSAWRNLLIQLERPNLHIRTTSMGRLFDAIAALTGVCDRNRFEGQAAMALEHAADSSETAGDTYPAVFMPSSGDINVIDTEPMVRSLLYDIGRGIRPGRIAASFHRWLADIQRLVARELNFREIVISGGCFQNARLVAETIRGLEADGRMVYRHRDVPPNDGGISLGQIKAAAMGLQPEPSSDQDQVDAENAGDNATIEGP